MNLLELNHVEKSFGDLSVLKDISLSVGEGEIVSIIGPSGSGKSTLLRCATMLETMDHGEIVYLGKRAAWTGADGKVSYADKKDMKEIRSQYGLVFQNFNLFPHYSVLKNITDAPIHVQKRDKETVYKEARELLKKMGHPDGVAAVHHCGGHCGHVCRHWPVRHEPPPPGGGELRQQHPHDERGYRHRRQPVPAVRGVLQRLGRLCRVGELLAVGGGAAGAADHGLRHPADRPCLLQHSVCHPVRGAKAAADGPEPHRRGPGPGLHLDAGLLAGGDPGDQARHRVRRADGLHHEH